MKVSDLPPDALELEMGEDDNFYYNFRFTIEVTYQSGSTKYGLLHKGEQQFPSRQKAGNLGCMLIIGWKANDIV